MLLISLMTWTTHLPIPSTEVNCFTNVHIKNNISVYPIVVTEIVKFFFSVTAYHQIGATFTYHLISITSTACGCALQMLKQKVLLRTYMRKRYLEPPFLMFRFFIRMWPHRNATSGHYLGLTDRLQLGTDLLASCGKLLYAFLWQVRADIFYADVDTFFMLMLVLGTDLLCQTSLGFLWQVDKALMEMLILIQVVSLETGCHAGRCDWS